MDESWKCQQWISGLSLEAMPIAKKMLTLQTLTGRQS
jgi:hypothetical protein